MSRRKSQDIVSRYGAPHVSASQSIVAQRSAQDGTTAARASLSQTNSQPSAGTFQFRRNGERSSQPGPKLNSHGRIPSSSPTEFRAEPFVHMSPVDRIASVYTNRIASGVPLDQTGRKRKEPLKKHLSDVYVSEDSKHDIPSATQTSRTTSSQSRPSFSSQDSLRTSLIPRSSSNVKQGLKRGYSGNSFAPSSVDEVKRARLSRTSPRKEPLVAPREPANGSPHKPAGARDDHTQEPLRPPLREPIEHQAGTGIARSRPTSSTTASYATPQLSMAELLKQATRAPSTTLMERIGSISAPQPEHPAQRIYIDLSIDDLEPPSRTMPARETSTIHHGSPATRLASKPLPATAINDPDVSGPPPQSTRVQTAAISNSSVLRGGIAAKTTPATDVASAARAPPPRFVPSPRKPSSVYKTANLHPTLPTPALASAKAPRATATAAAVTRTPATQLPIPTPAPKAIGTTQHLSSILSPRRNASTNTVPTSNPQFERSRIPSVSSAPILRPLPAATLGQRWSIEEDKFLIYLKEVKLYTWKNIAPFFPGRKWTSLQSRYSQTIQPGKPGRPTDLHHGLPTNDAVPSRAGQVASTQRVVETDPETDSSVGIHSRRVLRRTICEPSQTNEPVQVGLPSNDQPNDQKEVKALSKELHQTVLTFSCDRILRTRALGLTGGRTGPRQLDSAAKDYAFSTFGPHSFMDNASGDVSTVAWSPNGKVFAAGAVAVVDDQSQQYNKQRNLVIGDAALGKAKELPQHQVPRPRVVTGENAKESMRKSQDPVIYHTVQMVTFAPDGENMYSVSLDRRLNIYSIRDDVFDTEYLRSINHEGPVDLLAVSNRGYVATGCKFSGPQGIRVLDENYNSVHMPSTATAAMRKYPSALKWGVAPQHSQYLLAGFSCEVNRIWEEDDPRDKDGETCLWDVRTGQRLEVQHSNRNVFDMAWNPNPSPTSTIFAVACGSAGKTINPGIRSVVRLYAPNQGGTTASRTAELDCPAWDINDVAYCPHDTNIVAVGDTEGKVYIWDLRQIKKEQEPLQTLEHGKSRSALSRERNRWEVDTGIRFLSWGDDRNRLFTGSSDGVVKCWNPYRSDEEKHVRDVATFNSAIMSGAFSPDYCSLLIGEDTGRLNILSIGNEHKSNAQMTSLRVQTAEIPETQESYTSAANALVRSGQIKFKPMGTLPIRQAVQGSKYSESGIYQTDTEAPTLRANAAKLQEKLLRTRLQRKSEFQANPHYALSPCTLDCAYNPTNLEDDELKETGRSRDRIPDNLRNPHLLSGLNAQIQGLVAKCVKCGNLARPADSDDKTNSDAKPLCEKCRFACFRCSQPARVSGRGRVVECLACGLAWRAGVLGYDLIRDGKAGGKGNGEQVIVGLDGAGMVGIEEEMDEFAIAGPVMDRYFDQGR